MKKIHLIASSIAALLAANASAEHNLYLRMGTGSALVTGKVKESTYIIKNAGDTTWTASDSFEDKKSVYGTVVDFAIGHRINENIRGELQYTRLLNQNTRYPAPSDSTMNAAALPIIAKNFATLSRRSETSTLNLYYDFVTDSDITPYVGLAAGYGTTQYSVSNYHAPIKWLSTDGSTNYAVDPYAMSESNTKNTKKAFVGGGMVGMSYKVNQHVSLDVGYKIMTLAGAETNLGDPVEARSIPAAGDTYVISGAKDLNLNASILNNSKIMFAATTIGTSGAEIDLVKRINGENITPIAAKAKGPNILHSINLGLRLNF